MPTTRARRKKPHLLEGLGLIGLDDIEPVVVAAAAAELPMLLVGPHGTGKSLLLTRVAEARPGQQRTDRVVYQNASHGPGRKPWPAWWRRWTPKRPMMKVESADPGHVVGGAEGPLEAFPGPDTRVLHSRDAFKHIPLD